MTTPLSPTDLQNLQKDLLKGNVSYDQLPASAVAQLEKYWGDNPQALNSGQTSERQVQDLAAQRQSQADQGGILNSPIFKPIEWLGSKAYGLYSNTASPFISTLALDAHNLIWGYENPEDANNLNLKSLWAQGHAVSPGQAIWMLGLSNEELKERGISPSQITKNANPDDFVWSGFFSKPPQVTTVEGEKAKDSYFNNGAAKYVSGAADFGVSWYVDPLVITGKAAGALKVAGFTKPVSKAVGASKGIGVGSFRIGAKSADFDKLATDSTFNKMVSTVMDVKAKNPDSAALVLARDLPTFRKSANGANLARLLDAAKDETEVNQILRISMGDYKGYLGLEAKNMNLAYQVKTMDSQVKVLDTSWQAASPAWKQSFLGQRARAYIDSQSDMVQKLDDELRVVRDKMDAFGTIDNMNFNRATTPLGVSARGAAQNTDLKQVLGKGIIRATPALIYNTAVGFPIKLIRSYNDIKPTGYIDIHAEDSWKEVQESLREVRGLSRADREALTSDYVAATPNERGRVLVDTEKKVVNRILDNVNELRARKGKQPLDRQMADDLFAEYVERRAGAQANGGRAYSSARVEDPNNPGVMLRVAAIDSDGSRLVPTPLYETQLANNHVMMNFKAYERVLAGDSGDALAAAFVKGNPAWTKAAGIADTLNSVWKFAQLFRLGYGPRALADDFLSQVARFGPIAMLARTGEGGVSFANKLTNGTWAGSSRGALEAQLEIQQHALETHLRQLTSRSERLQSDITGITTHNANNPVQAQKSFGSLHTDHADTLQEIADTKADLIRVANTRNAAKSADKTLAIGREVFESPLGGPSGSIFRDTLAGQKNVGNMLGRGTDWFTKLARSGAWDNIDPAIHGVTRHADAWERKITRQVAQSAIGRQALAGKSDSEIATWLNTPEGRQYKRDVPGSKNKTDIEIARDVKADVDDLMNPNIPGMQALRQAALDGNLKMEDLLAAVPVRARPIVNGESFKVATGVSDVIGLMDNTIDLFYKFAAQLPAEKLLRNPLFAQQYRSAVKEQFELLKSQGVTHLDDGLRQRIEASARQKAIKDVKSYTFNMDHQSKFAYAFRNLGAFVGAQQESLNRWMRILSDKPQVGAHVANAYQAPARAGLVVDQDGNPVDGMGYSTNPITGERKLADYSDRHILFQIPEELGRKGLNKALGLDPEAKFDIPMSTAEIIFNHGDGAVPVGAGPYVQIAANHFAQDDPKFADWAQKLGVLPFGPQDSVWDFVNPTTGKRLGDSMDDFSENKQRMLAYMMQVENYKWKNGMRDSQPTWAELKDRADTWSIARTAFAFGLPISINQQDPYQFFRDEYKRMQDINFDSADEAFYEKYGDSFYGFTQAMSKNATGIRPTNEGVYASKYWSDLISELHDPSLAPVIVGQDQNGEYSQGALFYQKTHATQAGSANPDRTQLSAQDSFKQSQVSLGWKQYQSAISEVNAELFSRGLTSFSQKGAEDLAARRSAIIYTLTEPTNIDGSVNQWYNQDWADDFGTQNKELYDSRAHDLQKVVDDPLMWSKAVQYDKAGNPTVGVRSDIYSLKTYLFYRGKIELQLQQRDRLGGSGDITAKENGDLRSVFSALTMNLIESDTKFEYLHSRYFAKDMGFDINEQQQIEDQTGPLGQADVMQAANNVAAETDDNAAQLRSILNGGA